MLAQIRIQVRLAIYMHGYNCHCLGCVVFSLFWEFRLFKSQNIACQSSECVVFDLFWEFRLFKLQNIACQSSECVVFSLFWEFRLFKSQNIAYQSSECVVFSLFWEFSLFKSQNTGQTFPSEQICHQFSRISLHNKIKIWQALANYSPKT